MTSHYLKQYWATSSTPICSTKGRRVIQSVCSHWIYRTLWSLLITHYDYIYNILQIIALYLLTLVSVTFKSALRIHWEIDRSPIKLRLYGCIRRITNGRSQVCPSAGHCPGFEFIMKDTGAWHVNYTRKIIYDKTKHWSMKIRLLFSTNYHDWTRLQTGHFLIV